MPQRETTEAFFPVKVGLYHLYDVDEITYSLSDDPDTTSYELKSVVTDSFPNAGGDFIYVVHRFKKQDDADSWVALETWSIRKGSGEVVVNEGNVAFVKLRWPLQDGDAWDGNAYNSRGEDEYTVQFEESFTVNGVTFNNFITVEQELNEDPIVYTDVRYEKYAPDVGLIYKEITQLHYCVEQSCNNENVIVDGIVLKQRLKSYGVE